MICAVSDLHGCRDAWLRALAAISFSESGTLCVPGY